MKTVAVVGGGLVGSMMACFLAREGFEVLLFEMRPDIRKMEHVPGKSINLALSERGRSALRALGLEDTVLKNYAIPMHGRLIHTPTGRKRIIPYGRQGQYINSVGRRHLNEILLNEAESFENVKIHFNHKLRSCDFEKGKLSFCLLPSGEMKFYTADLIIGTDGAHSVVRQQMMKRTRLDYAQNYIEHGYLELCIPPTERDQFAMEVNYLHIWPRGTFMMIALPNQDKSYTVTLFMPFEQFEKIKSAEQLIAFFEANFKDSIELIGRDRLVKDFFKSPANSLISVKCKPYNYKNRAVLLGDAAHAMVPFYGQGMNCGFEDCLVFKELVDSHGLEEAVTKFSDARAKDCHVICDLAMYNYVEMRDLVNSPWFILRKYLDNLMNRVLRAHWVPLYSMVTFSRTRYSDCLENRKFQDRCVKTFTNATAALIIASGAMLLLTWNQWKLPLHSVNTFFRLPL